MDKKSKRSIDEIVKEARLSISDKLLQGEIEGIEFREKDLTEWLQEDIKDEDPIVEAFQKRQLKKSLAVYKKIRELYQKALELSVKKRGGLIREAMLLECTAENGINSIFYDKDSEEELREEFQEFKNNLK